MADGVIILHVFRTAINSIQISESWLKLTVVVSITVFGLKYFFNQV